MMVTLNQLRPYDHDPRVTRNPAYAEIKASIRERGLDAPPAITRRPGEAHYIIRNGGNTRLAILRELWSERSEEHTSELQSLMRISYAVFCLKKKNKHRTHTQKQ